MSEIYLTKKSLGQHWLFDAGSLQAMAEAAEVKAGESVLEVGPGLGTLTEALLKRGAHVTAVEFDKKLAEDLRQNIHGRHLEQNNVEPKDLTHSTQILQPVRRAHDKQAQDEKLQIFSEDILKFDLTRLLKNYKVCANIPYYLTSNLVRRLLESDNPPAVIALLIQKEVAERIAASPGEMSILSVATQFYAEVALCELVPASLFTPPPKVDSQIIKITRRSEPLFPDVDAKLFFTLVRAGFSEKRKKLRSSLSGGLHLSKTDVDQLLEKAAISPNARAQELSLQQWHELYLALER